MSSALAEIPPVGRRILGAHATWGLFLWLGYPFLGESAQIARPALIMGWFGTSTMFMIFGLVVASAGWLERETRYLAALLIFDLAALAVSVELVRTGG
jgi:hypothetical protein